MRAEETESPPAGGAPGHANPGAAPSTAVLTQPRPHANPQQRHPSTLVEVGPYAFGLTERELAAEKRRLRREGWRRWEVIERLDGLRVVRAESGAAA